MQFIKIHMKLLLKWWEVITLAGGRRSDAGRNGMMDIQQILLSKMELLVGSFQDFRNEVKGERREGFAAETVRRQEDNNRLREQLSKGFDAEQRQIRKEMELGAEKARKQVQDDRFKVKEQIKQLQLKSWCTACRWS